VYIAYPVLVNQAFETEVHNVTQSRLCTSTESIIYFGNKIHVRHDNYRKNPNEGACLNKGAPPPHLGENKACDFITWHIKASRNML